MAITKIVGRQEVISARATFALADLTSGSAVAAIDIPANARVIGVELRIETAFNSGTTDAMVIQNNEGTPKAFITIAAGLSALAANKVWSADPSTSGTAGSPIGYTHPVAATIDVLWTGAGTAATTGSGTLLVQYVLDNRAAFSEG